jgi:phosphatidylinositol alpha-1,6-mannosyltransferase
VTRHLLVTNDFPPKVGGIQSYLWEVWRRLDPDTFAVLTARSHPGHAAFDTQQRLNGYHIDRTRSPLVYFPTPWLMRTVRRAAHAHGASLVVLDPVVPLGLLGPSLGLPYAVVLHGAELAIPGRLPIARQAVARVLEGASLLVAAGRYPAAEARRATRHQLPPIVEVPPGIDATQFRPLVGEDRAAARRALGLPEDGLLVASVSRLVPRKGMDTLIRAAVRLGPSFPDLTVAIAGTGRDEPRVRRLVSTGGARIHLLGRLPEDEKGLLLGASDVFVMACRDRWLGLEQEGFGIVFLEAAAAGVPQVAGASGGAAEAVEDGVTGLVVRRPDDVGAVALALRRLLVDPNLRHRMGEAARMRVLTSFDYDDLAPRLARALAEVAG